MTGTWTPSASVLSVVAMGGIVLSILVWQEGGEAVAALLIVGAIAMGTLVYWLTRRKREGKPTLIDPDLFTSKMFRFGITGQMMQQIALGGMMIALPIYLQMVLEYSAMGAGLSMAPLSLSMFAIALLAGKRAGKRRPAGIIRAGFALLTLGLLVLIPIVPRASSGWGMLVPLLIAGSGLGLLVSQLNNYTLSPISEERVSEAAGVNSAAGSFGLSFGLAFAGAIMLATLSFSFTNLAAQSTVLSPAEQQQVADTLEHDAEIMSNTALQKQIADEPQAVQDEILSINTDARHRALQVALLIPLLAGLDRVDRLVPHDAAAGPGAVIGGRRHGPRLTSSFNKARPRPFLAGSRSPVPPSQLAAYIAGGQACVSPRVGDSGRLGRTVDDPRAGPSLCLRTSHVARERPTDERVGVPVTHAILRFQVPHDGHVLLAATLRDDPLPLRDRAPVLLLDGREVRCRTLLRPGRCVLDRADVLSSQSDEAPLATSPMISASSCGRDHMGQWLVGRSTQVTSRSSPRPAMNACPSLTASLYWSLENAVQITVDGTSSRRSLVRSAAPRSASPGSGMARFSQVASCSSLIPSRFSSSRSSSSGGSGFSTPSNSGSRAPFAGPVST